MNLHKEFFRFVLPSMLAFALSGVYAIADGFFVGNALGDQALAAINIAYPLTALLQAVGTGIGMGGAVLYTISAGNHDAKNKSRFFGLSLLLLFTSSLLLMLLLLLFAPLTLQLFGASGQVLLYGEEYILYIAYGAISQVMATGLVPFIRNMGGAVTAMAAMVAGFVTNIFFDYLFVWVLPYGMMGAALATVIGQAVTLVICVFFLIRKRESPVFTLQGKETLHIIGRIIRTGISPLGLAYSPNITLILVNKSAAVSGGDFAVTCYAAISYISCVIMLLLQGISDGSQPLVSLFYGKGDEKEAKHIRNISYWFSAAVAGFCMAALFLFRDNTAVIFGVSHKVGAYVAQVLPLFLIGYVFASFSRSTTAYFYASEKNLAAYAIIYGEPLCLFSLLLVLPPHFGILGTWAAVPGSQFFVALLSVLLLWKPIGPLCSRHKNVSEKL